MMEGLFSPIGLLFIAVVAVLDFALAVVIGKFLGGVQEHYPDGRSK